MACEGPPRTEEILCVRVPCREGRARVWRAIELLRQGNEHRSSPWSGVLCAGTPCEPGVGQEVPETGGPVCPRVYRQTRTGGNRRELGGPALPDRGGL
jgi:hypothetical protein